MASTKRSTDYKVRTIFSADDRLTKSLRTIVGRGVRSIRSLASASKTAAIGIAGIGAAGAGAAYGVYRLIRSYSESVDALDEQATAIGMSAQALREWQGVAERNGIGADAMTSALSRMNIAVSGVHNGTGKLNKMLKEHLPLVYKQVKGAKTNEEAQAILFRAIRAVGDESDQAALAAAIFGREVGPKLLNVVAKTDEEIASMRGNVRRLRGELSDASVKEASDFEDAIRDVGDSLKKLRDAIGSELVKAAMPAVRDLTEWLTDNRAEVAKEIAGAIKETAKALAEVDWKGIGQDMLSTVKAIAGVFEQIDDLMYSITGRRGGRKIGAAGGLIQTAYGNNYGGIMAPISAAPATAEQAAEPILLRRARRIQSMGGAAAGDALSPQEWREVERMRSKQISGRITTVLGSAASMAGELLIKVQAEAGTAADVFSTKTTGGLKLKAAVHGTGATKVAR